MITLYSKDFSTKYGVISSLCEAFVEEERNGLFELSFIMLNTDSLFKYIKEENIVVANANDTLLNQKFRIYMTRKLMNNRVEVFARHISFDLMYDYIDNLSFENQSCEYALNQLFRNSNFSTHYRGYSDIVNAQNYNMSMANVLEAIGGKKGSIIDTFGTGAEILRDNENIHVLNKRGYDNEVTIEYKKNLTGFELEEDTTDLVTRISPYAKYNDSETNEEIIVKADYVDSPLIANYSHPYIKAIDYSDKFGDGEIPTVSKLQDLARKEYKNNKVDMPKQNFKIEFIPLSKCVGYEGLEDKISLCDIVTIIDTRYNINTQAKVIKVTFNVLKNRYESMELGEPRTSLGDVIGSEIGNNVTEDEVKDIINSTPSVNFPNTLPPKSILKGKSVGLASIELNWTFENKNYYSYELYASKTRDFTPNSFYLIHEGQTSSYLFQAKPNETWYFKVCAKNSHGNRNAFSDEISVSTAKIDANEWIEEATIGNALIGELSADKITSGTISGYYIDARNLSVTDGSGKRTLDIDSFGNVHIKASSFSLQGKNIATEEDIRKTVKSVDVMYYLSTSQTSLTGGTWSTTAPAWVNGKYMWSKTVTTYTDNTVSESSPTCIAGAKGDTGNAGKGVKTITNYYLSTNSSSGITVSTTGWTETIQSMSSSKKYLWNYEKVTYTDNSYTNTTPCIIGNYASDGTNGTNGIDGVNGKGIKSIIEYYLVSSKSTGITTSTSGWSTNIPNMTVENKYLWNYEKISYTDDTFTIGTPKIIGVYGDTGLDGVGVSEIIEEYYLSTSNTSQTGGTWTTSVPTWSKGKFIWTRSKIIYTNGRIDYTTPICDSTWQAIDQQTSEDVFNKLTDNGNKQGLYMQDNQLYVNGQYVNAKNLKVVNNEGTKTLDIDSLGNVNLDVASLKIKTKNVATQIDLQGKVSFSDLSTSGSTTINGANIITGTITGNKISGGIIEGTTLKTATPTSNGGVWIKENAIQLGGSNFLYEGNTFKIETGGNTSYSSTGSIFLMPGMSGASPTGNGYVNVSGNLSCNRIEGSAINSSGNIYASGTLGCSSTLTAGNRITSSGEIHAYDGVSKLGYYAYFTPGYCYSLKINNSYLAATGSGFHVFSGGTSTYGYLYTKNVLTGYSLDEALPISENLGSVFNIIDNLEVIENEGLKIKVKEEKTINNNERSPVSITKEGLTQIDNNGMLSTLLKAVQELKQENEEIKKELKILKEKVGA